VLSPFIINNNSTDSPEAEKTENRVQKKKGAYQAG
jgi:hypothetical protein